MRENMTFINIFKSIKILLIRKYSTAVIHHRRINRIHYPRYTPETVPGSPQTIGLNLSSQPIFMT